MKTQDIVAETKKWVGEDTRRMQRRPEGFPRAAWREENPIAPLRLPVTRKVWFTLGCNGDPYDLWVWTKDQRKKGAAARINLRSKTAQTELETYLA